MSSLSQYLASALSGPVAELSGQQVFLALIVVFLVGAQAAITTCLLPNVAWGLAAVALSPQRPGPAYLAYGGVAVRFALGYVLSFAALSLEAGWNGRPFPSWLSSPLGWTLWLAFAAAIATSLLRRRPFALSIRESNALSLSFGFLAAMLPTQCHPITFPVILLYIAQTRAIALGLALTLGYALGMSTLPFLCAWFSGSLRRPRRP